MSKLTGIRPAPQKYYATLEFCGRRSATLMLTDHAGEWAGSGRVEGRNHSEVYERGYTLASMSAQAKGGRLERYSQIAEPEPPPSPSAWYSRACSARVVDGFLHRPSNALNIEPMQPTPRCLDKKPPHWPAGSSAIRWRASGGGASVFGPCSANCPRKGLPRPE